MSALSTAENTSPAHSQDGGDASSPATPVLHISATPHSPVVHQRTSQIHSTRRSTSPKSEASVLRHGDKNPATPHKRPRLSGTFSPVFSSVTSDLKVRTPEVGSPQLSDEVPTGFVSKHGELVNTKRRRRPSTSKSQMSLGDKVVQPCPSCSGVEEVISSILSNLVVLQSEVSSAFALSGAKIQTDGPSHSKFTGSGLRRSLEFAAAQIQKTSLAVQSAAVAKTGLPPLTEAISLQLHAGPPSWGRAVNHQQEDSRAQRAQDALREEIYSQPSPSEPRPGEPSSYGHALPPLLPADGMGQRRQSEQEPPRSTQSPHAVHSGSPFTSTQSPIQMSSASAARMLPSPSSLQHYSSSSTVLPSHYQPGASLGAQASHLQDLQHQISTKTLALQTLQREHDQLLAAFSRSQTRCSALEKKSHVSDHEINSLSEEKARLQAQVETMEGQVEELQASREGLLKQSSADGAQWRQIMAMSSQLQAKGADDARRYKGEKDTWEQERQELKERIRKMEGRRVDRPQHSPSSYRETDKLPSTDVLVSGSVEELRQEVMDLRSRCTQMECVLQDICGEAEHITDAVKAISRIRESFNKPMSGGGASERD